MHASTARADPYSAPRPPNAYCHCSGCGDARRPRRLRPAATATHGGGVAQHSVLRVRLAPSDSRSSRHPGSSTSRCGRAPGAGGGGRRWRGDRVLWWPCTSLCAGRVAHRVLDVFPRNTWSSRLWLTGPETVRAHCRRTDSARRAGYGPFATPAPHTSAAPVHRYHGPVARRRIGLQARRRRYTARGLRGALRLMRSTRWPAGGRVPTSRDSASSTLRRCRPQRDSAAPCPSFRRGEQRLDSSRAGRRSSRRATLTLNFATVSPEQADLDAVPTKLDRPTAAGYPRACTSRSRLGLLAAGAPTMHVGAEACSGCAPIPPPASRP